MVEERLATLKTGESDSEPNSPEQEVFEDAIDDAKEVCVSISKQALAGTESSRSMKLLGSIQGRDVLILIDSGSSNNFISSKMAQHLSGVQVLQQPRQVRVAGGGLLQATAEIPDCQWLCQGHTFATSLKVLPLTSYDVILGMQWLEQFGLMTTHWAEKWFQFSWQGKLCKLQGICPNTESCHRITGAQLQELQAMDSIQYLVQLYAVEEHVAQTTVPQIIPMVLRTYETLFEEPKGLPPRRKSDHTIPLLSGASPVNVRPYRYSPMQKNEIERQIKEMLQQGICNIPIFFTKI